MWLFNTVVCDHSGWRGWRARCGSSWWTMFRKVKKRHSSSSSQSSEISTKSKVRQHTYVLLLRSHFLLVEFSQHSLVFLTLYSLWTPVWEGSPDQAQSPASTQTPPRAQVSLSFLCVLHFSPLSFSNWFIRYVLSLGNSTSDTCAEFRVKYVGAIEKLQFNMSKTLQEPLELISYIDAAQVRSRGRK